MEGCRDGRGRPRCATRRCGRRLEPGEEELALHGTSRRIHEQLRLRRHDGIAAGDIDDTDDAARLRVVHGRRCARPRLHATIEVLGPPDLHGAAEAQGRPGRGRADGILAPVRPCDEPHSGDGVAQSRVPLDPEQPSRGVADRDDDARVAGISGEQESADEIERGRERMPEPVAFELLLGQGERRETLDVDEAVDGAAPAVAHERTDILDPAVAGVPAHELFVRPLDQQARGLRRDPGLRCPRRGHGRLRSRSALPSVYVAAPPSARLHLRAETAVYTRCLGLRMQSRGKGGHEDQGRADHQARRRASASASPRTPSSRRRSRRKR